MTHTTRQDTRVVQSCFRPLGSGIVRSGHRIRDHEGRTDHCPGPAGHGSSGGTGTSEPASAGVWSARRGLV